MELEYELRVYTLGWEWFKLHAQQRMQLVNFWFVAMSFLTTAAILAYSVKQYGGALLIACCIVFASLIFLLLDRRTRELISYGERLMAATEARLKLLPVAPEVVMVGAMHTSGRKEISYRLLFTALYGGAAFFGMIAIALSAVAL